MINVADLARRLGNAVGRPSAARLRLGILMNFNVDRMVHGIKRVIR